MKTFTATPLHLGDEEIITVLRLPGWFIGRGFEFGDKTNFDPSDSPITFEIVDHESSVPFDQQMPFFAVWQLGLSPLILNATVSSVRPEVFLVCHKPIVLEGREFVVGYDRAPVDRSVFGEGNVYPLGRIDLWDVNLLKNSSFPDWKGSKFCFVTIAP